MKEIIKDVFRNFRVPILLGILGVVVFTTYVTDFDESNMHWYYIGITICSGGGVACIIYGLKKYLKK